MKLYAVITGDIIGSGKLAKEEREDLLSNLKSLFGELNRHITKEKEPPAEIFRGDSFQMVLQQPEQALLVGLLIRARLRSLTASDDHEAQNYWDARVAIGIGEVTFRADRIVESDGTAFHLSGRGLDDMKKKRSLRIRTPWPEVDEELEVACALSETIVNRWTIAQAKVIYPYLLEKKTQQALAKAFNITQGAVSQRLNEAGNVDAIKLFIRRYEQLIARYC